MVVTAGSVITICYTQLGEKPDTLHAMLTDSKAALKTMLGHRDERARDAAATALIAAAAMGASDVVVSIVEDIDNNETLKKKILQQI